MPSDALPWLTIDDQPERQWVPRLDQRADAMTQPVNLIGTGTIGHAVGEPFRATLLALRGLQNVRSHRYAILQLTDGTLRGWPIESFSPLDQLYLTDVEEKATAVAIASRIVLQEPEPRTVEYIDYDPVEDDLDFDLYETEHFAYYIGKEPESEGEIAFQAAFLEDMWSMFEQVWSFFEHDLNYPMPFSDALRQPFDWPHVEQGWHKINVYLLYTGLPRHTEGWANAGRQISMSPLSMLEGSSVIPHEFAHVVQLYTNGFLTNPTVGYFWETHASWCTHQMIPAYDADLTTYLNQLYQPINWSGFRYGSWMLLQHLTEDPRFGPDFIRDMWLEVGKDEQFAATEDPMQVIMRMGRERGLFSDDATQALGDIIGEMAARMVTFDYVYQQTYLDSAEQKLVEPWLMRRGVPLKSLSGGMYMPLTKYMPGQWAINHIRLQPTADTVTVRLHRVDSHDVSWRLTLVAYDEQGQAIYSDVSADDQVSLEVAGWPHLVLAVAAIPGEHKPLPFEVNLEEVRRYHYALEFDGAQPYRG